MSRKSIDSLEIPVMISDMEMFAHQKSFVDFAESKNFCCCNWSDIGVGKTRMGIEAFKRLRASHPMARLLVICPLSLIESAWIEDIRKFAPELGVDNIRKNFTNACAVCLINYDTFITKKFQEFFNWQIKESLGKEEWMCILDESSRMKNHSSLTTKTLLKCRDLFQWRIAMSATPAPNTMMEYWPQVEFISPGLLHKSFYAFRNIWFHLGRGKQVLQGALIGKEGYAKVFSQGWKYQITEEKKKILMERIAAVSFRCNKDECLDLPETIDEVRKVEMGSNQRRHYNQMKNELVTQIRDENVVAQFALTKIMKLRQICSGFAITPEGTGLSIGENPKLSELLSVLEECGDQQVIIWCQFHFEIDTVMSALGEKARALYSLTEDKDDVIRCFKNGTIQYLVANPRSAGHGHTFVNSSVEVFYALDYSWESYEQARGRVHRAGQVQKVTYIHILCKDSIEEAILSCLRRKADAFEVLNEVMR